MGELEILGDAGFSARKAICSNRPVSQKGCYSDRKSIMGPRQPNADSCRAVVNWWEKSQWEWESEETKEQHVAIGDARRDQESDPKQLD